jgi:hypothetical protein
MGRTILSLCEVKYITGHLIRIICRGFLLKDWDVCVRERETGPAVGRMCNCDHVLDPPVVYM